MSSFKIIVYILISCIVATSSFADIYKRTDENGVKHYSNHPPVSESRFMMKTKEKPYNEEVGHDDRSYPVSSRWYYRITHTRSYQNQFSGRSPHPRNRHGKKHYGSKNSVYAHEYRYKTHYRQNRSYTDHQLNSRATTIYRGYRIGSSSVRLNGQGNPSLRSFGFGRRH